MRLTMAVIRMCTNEHSFHTKNDGGDGGRQRCFRSKNLYALLFYFSKMQTVRI